MDAQRVGGHGLTALKMPCKAPAHDAQERHTLAKSRKEALSVVESLPSGLDDDSTKSEHMQI
jgi:hypothetical protein